MTNFLFILSTEKKNLETTARLLPSRFKHTNIIDNKGIQILISDFNSKNHLLEHDENNYLFAPNTLKHLDLVEDSNNKKTFPENIQPFIRINMKDKKIVISTEPLGTDYIYLSVHNDRIYLSSHMRYILQNEKELIKHLDYDALLEYTYSHCILGMKTFFKKIKLLPANKTISLNFADFHKENIEELIFSSSKDKFNFPQNYEEMDNQKYKKAVSEQAEVFTQYFNILFKNKPENNIYLLSGGLDSRLLLTSTRDDLRKKSKCITFDYTDKGGNITNAKRVANVLEVEHITRLIKAEETVGNALKHLWWCEGISTHLVSYLIPFLSMIESQNNLFVDGYLGDTQLGGEFFTCIKKKNLRLDSSRSLLKAMQLHNYFFPSKEFNKIAKEKNVLKRIIIPGLKKHVEMVWLIDNKIMKLETLLALTRGRKYTLGGPKTVETFGTTVFPFYHPQIYCKYIRIPSKFREKRNYELDILGVLNEEVASLRTTSSKFKRLKIVQYALKTVRWIEKKIGISIIPKSSSPVFMWTDKNSPYYKFINKILGDEDCFIWNLFDKNTTRKMFQDLFERKNHLELFLASLIDLEIIMRLYFSLEKPETIFMHSDNLSLHKEIKLKLEVYDLQKEIYN